MGFVPAEKSDTNKPRAKKKYIFIDDTPQKTDSIPPSPLERSDTVVWNPSEHKHILHIRKTASTLEVDSAPSPNALHASSAGNVERRPSDDTSRRILQSEGKDTRNDFLRSDLQPVFYASAAQRPAWLRGASGVLASSSRATSEPDHEPACDPAIEESDFGGIDEFIPHTRSHSDGSGAKSLHLYNMRISQRLASQGTLPTTSNSKLRNESSSELSWDREPEYLSLGPRRQISSSGVISQQGPSSLNSLQKRASSSVYTQDSRRGSLPKTVHVPPQAVNMRDKYPPNSYHRGKSTVSVGTQVSRQSSIDSTRKERGDTQWILRSNDPLDRNINTATSRHQSVVTKNLEATSYPTDPVSRSLSLPSHQIESAEDDQSVRGARTVNGNRYFSQQDLKELTVEIASRTPPSRSVSRYDGSGDAGSSRLRTPGATSPPRRPSMFAGDEPVESSVWEKALREHRVEDERLKNRRLGSTSTSLSKSIKSKNSSFRPLKSSHLQISSSSDADDVKAQLSEWILEKTLAILVQTNGFNGGQNTLIC